MPRDYVFTSESVTRGHPDKLCDQVSDAIVGRFLAHDALAKVVAECATSAGIIFISLKFLSRATIDIASAARAVVRDAGYDHPLFNPHTCAVMTSIIGFADATRQPPDEGTLSDAEIDRLTVNDQCAVFGYACRQTPELMPLPIALANKLARALDSARDSGRLPYLCPDGKVQVAIEFRNAVPHRIYGLTLIAAQRELEQPSPKRVRDDLREHVLDPVFAQEPIRPDARTRIDVNPDGPVLYGGPHLHAGLTGHKGGADTYGEFARQSGSSLSGKDPSRIDRSAVYAARHAAKNVVAAGLADACEVQLSYSIGHAAPVSVEVETFGTAHRDDVAARVRRCFDFRLGAIVRDYGLRALARRSQDGFYVKLAAYGQLARDELELPWEALDRVDALQQ